MINHILSCIVLTSFAGYSIAQVQSSAPEIMSVENSAAVVSDHKAVIESEKIATRLNQNQSIILLNQLKSTKIEEQIALSNKVIAQARSDACTANRAFCDKNIKDIIEPTSTPEEKQLQFEMEEAKNKQVERNRINAANRNYEKGRISQFKLVGLTSTEAYFMNNGEAISLSQGEILEGIQLSEIKRSSVVLVGKKMGITKEIFISNSSGARRNTIAPIVQKDKESAKPAIGAFPSP